LPNTVAAEHAHVRAPFAPRRSAAVIVRAGP